MMSETGGSPVIFNDKQIPQPAMSGKVSNIPVWYWQQNIVDISPGIHVQLFEFIKDLVCQMHVSLASC